MMLKDALEKLEKDSAFLEWKQNNPGSFLAHVFWTLDKQHQDCQVGYYDLQQDKVITFKVGEKVERDPPAEILKKPGAAVEELNLNEVKLKLYEALEAVHALQEEKYPQEKPVKKIVILQKIPEWNIVYNITYVTQTMKTFNAKVDAGTGKVVQEGMHKLFDFSK
jgi:hypothetical protein